jgi:5'-3' exonuclease
VILIDLNQIAIANVVQQININKDSIVEEGFVRHMILNSIRSIKCKFQEEYGELILCSDSNNYWRKELFPQYKANRKRKQNDSEIDWSQIFKILNKIKMEIKENFPYKFIEISTCEADDIIGTLSKNFSDKEKILIVSTDKDFVQLQKYDGVSQYSTITKSWIQDSDPETFLLEKILRGDKGDGIPNYLSDDDSFYPVVKRQKSISKKRINDLLFCKKPESLMSSKEVKGYMRNRYLIDLEYIPEDLQNKIMESFNIPPIGTPTHVYRYLMSNGLKALINNIGDFT